MTDQTTKHIAHMRLQRDLDAAGGCVALGQRWDAAANLIEAMQRAGYVLAMRLLQTKVSTPLDDEEQAAAYSFLPYPDD